MEGADISQIAKNCRTSAGKQKRPREPKKQANRLPLGVIASFLFKRGSAPNLDLARKRLAAKRVGHAGVAKW
jgi:hypothetical protein